MNSNKKTEYLCYNGPIGNNGKHNHLKLKIGVYGALDTGICGVNTYDIAKEIGHQIIIQGGILITGATTGFSMWSTIGAKEEKGIVIGISPAANEKEHVDVYRLPVDYMDLIIYTGFGFTGRDLLLTRSCDAIIIGCGRVGTINEFTLAYKEGKPVGILEGDWETSETIKKIINSSVNKSNNNVIYEKDIKILVKKLIKMTEINKSKNK